MFSSSFSRQTSNTLSPYQEIVLPSCESGRRGSNSRPLAWKANALSTELLPQNVCTKSLQTNFDTSPFNKENIMASLHSLFQLLWAKMDSNHRRRKPADLQSAPFGHSGICPFHYFRKRICDRLKKTACFNFEPLVGFEPTTPRLQITCSGQLS